MPCTVARPSGPSAHAHAPLGQRRTTAVVPGHEPQAQLLSGSGASRHPARLRQLADAHLELEDALGRVVLHDELLGEVTPELVHAGLEALRGELGGDAMVTLALAIVEREVVDIARVHLLDVTLHPRLAVERDAGDDWVLVAIRLAQEDALDASDRIVQAELDRKSTRLNSSHSQISYAVFC